MGGASGSAGAAPQFVVATPLVVAKRYSKVDGWFNPSFQ